jgi:hypothetical protein
VSGAWEEIQSKAAAADNPGEMNLDERGVIAAWLFKTVLVFVIVGVLLYEGGSIMVNFFTLDSKADEIVVEVTNSITSNEIQENVRAIEDEAQRLAEEAGVRLVKVNVNAEGTLHVRLKRTADTLVVSRIGAIEDWAKATADARGSTS